MPNKPEIKKWSSLLAVFGFVIFIVYLFFFTDFTEVAIIISRVNIPIYLLVFICVIVNAVFNSLTWKATLDNIDVKTTFKRVFNLSWVGHFIDCIIVGGWAGDVFITYLLGKDKNIDVVKVAASVIVKDILELLVVCLSLIVGIVLLILNYSINSFLLTAIGITMLFLALPLILIVYLSTNVSVTKKLLQFLVRITAKIKHKKSNDAFEQKIGVQITNFHNVIMIIKNEPKSMIKPIFYMTMTWFFNIVALYLVFISLGTVIEVDKILIANTIVSNVSGQGVALAGFSQIVSSSLYEVLGINISLAQASSLLAGFATFWFTFVISFIYFQKYGLGTIAERILNKAFEEKQKQDKKDFKEKEESNKTDFDDKASSDRKDFQAQADSNKKDFDEKNVTDERDYKEQRDSDKKDYEEKVDSDAKNFKEKTGSTERDYKEQKDTDKKDFKEKRDRDKKDFKEKMKQDKKDNP